MLTVMDTQSPPRFMTAGRTETNGTWKEGNRTTDLEMLNNKVNYTDFVLGGVKTCKGKGLVFSRTKLVCSTSKVSAELKVENSQSVMQFLLQPC